VPDREGPTPNVVATGCARWWTSRSRLARRPRSPPLALARLIRARERGPEAAPARPRGSRPGSPRLRCHAGLPPRTTLTGSNCAAQDRPLSARDTCGPVTMPPGSAPPGRRQGRPRTPSRPGVGALVAAMGDRPTPGGPPAG
jgi:hypothetical protein